MTQAPDVQGQEAKAEVEVARWSARQRSMLAEMGIRHWDSWRTIASLEGQAAPAAAISPQEPAPGAIRPKPPTGRPEAGGEPGAVMVPGAAPARQRPGFIRHELAPDPGHPTKIQPDAMRPKQGLDLDWPALQQAIETCRACGLCGSRKNVVVGAGSSEATWLIVGEAPGEEEDKRGEPFVGRAGQLLDHMLRAARLTRATQQPADSSLRRAYIANTVKCRPPSNRNPSLDELASCAPFLEQQIALLRPRIILAMGRFAAQALLGSQEPLGRLRGRVHLREGIPVVVTYHPAYLLRSPQDKALAWDDLCLAHDTYAAQGQGT